MDEVQLPVCPHCEREIKGIEWFHEALANLIVFVCPHCRKILSVQKTLDQTISMQEPVLPKQSEIM